MQQVRCLPAPPKPQFKFMFKNIYSLTRLCTDLVAGRGRVSDAAHDGALGTGTPHFTFHVSEKRCKKQKWDAKVNARGSKHCRICPGSPLSLQVQEGGQSVVKKLFGIETEVSVKCHEAPTEPLTCAVPSSLPPHHATPHPGRSILLRVAQSAEGCTDGGMDEGIGMDFAAPAERFLDLYPTLRSRLAPACSGPGGEVCGVGLRGKLRPHRRASQSQSTSTRESL